MAHRAPVAASEGPPSPSFAVVPVGDPPAIAADVIGWSGELQDALQKHGLRTLDQPAKLRRLGLEGADYGEIDAAYAQARAKASAGEFGESARGLRNVVEGLEQLFGYADTFPRWSRAMLQLARVEQLLSRHDEARGVVERLLHADPLIAPDPEIFPPSFMAAFDKIRSEVRRRPRARLVVSAGTSGAQIFLEGRPVGAGTATLNLPAGDYRVRVVVGEVRLKERTIHLKGGFQKVQIDASFAKALRRQPMVGLVAAEPERYRHLTELGSLLGVERLFVVTASRGGADRFLSVEVVRGSSGCALEIARLKLASSGPIPGGIAAVAAVLVKGEPSPLMELGLLQRSPASSSGSRPACGPDIPSREPPPRR